MIHLTINQKQVEVLEGKTILQAAQEHHIAIPNLCYLEGVHKSGSCRICSVEVVGAKTLMAACVTEVREGMVVNTNTKIVQDARKMLYQLVLSDHRQDCLHCSRNLSCELQQLGQQLGVTETIFDTTSARNLIDAGISITRDTSKCILCRRCVTVCHDIQGLGAINVQNRGFDSIIAPAMELPLSHVNCANCGQCIIVCPVGALEETDATQKVWQALHDPNIRVVMQSAPAVRVALGEIFGYPVGTSVTGKLAASMRALGADDVFDTNWAADLTIMEEGTELLHRLHKMLKGEKTTFPMITSCSPGWIKFVEHRYPELLEHLSSCKSPHMMLGAIAKSFYAARIGVDPRKMFVVSVMPCTAKKFEISREEMKQDGLADVDAVLTTRELGVMIRQAGIDFNQLPDQAFDDPMGTSTGAADIFGVTGGVMEAALRTVYTIISGRPLPFDNLHVNPIVGMEEIKEATLKLEGLLPEYKALEGAEVKVAVTSGLHGAATLMDQIAEGTSPYLFIEVMGCPGGCITGGGQPRSQDPEVQIKRMKALYQEDESKVLRESHKNPSIEAIYRDFLVEPCGEMSHHLLHTHYVARTAVLAKDLQPADKPGMKVAPVATVNRVNENTPSSSLVQEIQQLQNQIKDLKESEEIYKQIIADCSKRTLHK
jgi:NADH-quinone oxidoreductase subunit G/NADP-reducing hydrogenase subunit HndD